MDLTKYCGNDPFRPYLNKPFSHGDFSYATNGHIMVRVPRRDDIPEQTKEGNWNAPMGALEGATFAPVPHKPVPDIPAAKQVDCLSCDGRGREHECPRCKCQCEECGGTGKNMLHPKISTTLRGGTFDLRYVAMVLDLPNVELMTNKADAEKPMLFKFDGGYGALMPMRGKHENHIEIEVASVAA